MALVLVPARTFPGHCQRRPCHHLFRRSRRNCRPAPSMRFARSAPTST